MHSRLGGRPPFSSNPPLPHQPQEHFYNLPGLDLGLENGVHGGITPGEGGYYCGFDSLSMAADEPSRPAENVLLVGYQGGIDLFRVEKSRLDIIGRLEGLRGGVIGAKIIPWAARYDPCAASRPLIALVIHGPSLNDNKSTSGSSDTSSVVDDSSSDSPSRTPSSDRDSGARSVKYQTTVEIHSLKEQKQVAVLYRSALIPIVGPIDSPMFEPPPPAGDFVVDAKGQFVVVASGSSGEVFLFAPYLENLGESGERFRCIGKVWTSVSFRERGTHSSATSTTGSTPDETAHETYGVPLFSLSGRWLAVAPPASTTLLPLNGAALTSRHHAKPPGLTHHTVPPQPSPNCAVDAPETPGLFDRLAREGTQAAIKSARWATEKGYQAFKNYMNKPNGNPSGGYYGTENAQFFPPTHGHNTVPTKDDVAVVSIYDLQRFLDAEVSKAKHALHPIATILMSQGCSFLSFSPTGLMLITVSAKGDLQHVWDLKRMNFRRTRKTAREQPLGPHVRQVARFARLTVTNVVDVAWSAPRNDRLAIITDKGTVHMFPMPAYAYQWPPPRRTRAPASTPKPIEEQVSSTGRTGAISSAFQALNGTAKPLLNAVRVRNPSNGSRFPSLSSLGMTPAAGAKSGKAVAANVGKSINNIRHSGDNKLTLPMGSSGVKPRSVKWLTGRNRGCIALASGGVLQIYRISIRSASGSQTQTRISKSKPVEFGLAPIRDTVFAPAAAANLFQQQDSESDFQGEWLPRKLPAQHRKPERGLNGTVVSAPAPLSFSEIESNPPYQPFYTDRRATRYLLREDYPGHAYVASSQQPLPDLEEEEAQTCPTKNLCHLEDDGPWLFGSDIEAVRVATSTAHGYVSEDDEEDMAGLFENKMSLKDGDEETEHIVVTTKRRRRGLEGDGGFFEDDCDVLDFAEDRV